MKTTETTLNEQLSNGVAYFLFTKKDGSIREAAGTTNLELIPEANHPKGGKSSDNVICFFDLESLSWKCFIKTNLLGTF